MSSTVQAFRVHAADNVATLLSDAGEQTIVAVRGPSLDVAAEQPIRAGHKIALCALKEEDHVGKYGFPIGSASRVIAPGEWVHLQNCRSLYDSASSELDVESGVRTETRYV